MVKKGTKRKTRWRTLSIGDGGTDTSDTGITEIKQGKFIISFTLTLFCARKLLSDDT